MTDQHTTKTTPPAESTLLSNQCNAYMYACFKFSTPKWVMISTISDTFCLVCRNSADISELCLHTLQQTPQ